MNTAPPRFAERIVRWSVPSADRHVVLGDLEEEFGVIVATSGHAKANRWYWRQTLGSVAPNIVRRLNPAPVLKDAGVTWQAIGIVVSGLGLMVSPTAWLAWALTGNRWALIAPAIVVACLGVVIALFVLAAPFLPKTRTLKSLSPARRLALNVFLIAMFLSNFVGRSLGWLLFAACIALARVAFWPQRQNASGADERAIDTRSRTGD